MVGLYYQTYECTLENTRLNPYFAYPKSSGNNLKVPAGGVRWVSMSKIELRVDQ